MINNIIILEGIDRVGKSTLANIISNTFNIPIYKHIYNTNPENMNNNLETQKMFEILNVYNKNIIFNRFNWSDYVYGTLERNYINAEFNLNSLNNKLLKLNTIFILINPTDLFKSELEYGKPLKNHLKLFNQIYNNYQGIKHKTSYNNFNNTLTWLKNMLL